jgi:transposase InsO family protein
VIVNPETVVRWHRTRFRPYWSWLSGHQKAFGRKQISKEVRDLIFRMAAENPTWGAPRIHGELLKLGFDVSERTVSRWVHKARPNPQPAQRWKTFLENHREAIAAMDFFTVPTLTFGVLYCFFVIAHDRRRILHINVTRHPTGFWITQQLREAFSYDTKHKYLLHDRDAKFGNQVGEAVAALTLKSVRTSFRSPWQNGIAERWVGTCRRELLDPVIPSSEALYIHLFTALLQREFVAGSRFDAMARLFQPPHGFAEVILPDCTSSRTDSSNCCARSFLANHNRSLC